MAKNKNNGVYVIIPARGGSKGVPGKNIKELGGHPLLAYSIAAAKLSGRIARTIVSTDSAEIAQIAVRYGAEVPFLRPKKYATDRSPDLDFVLHALNWFKENEEQGPDYLVHLRPTTPLRDPLIVDSAIGLIMDDQAATSLRSGHAAAESPFKWFLRDEHGYFRPIREGMTNEECNLPRQSFPKVFVPDGYVDILKASFVTETRTLHGEKMIGFESPVCREVDTLEDFAYLEYEAAKRHGPLAKYLHNKCSKEIK
jgi:CMP-N,N'-diacetyllegionaminic acid synthase